MDIEQTQHAGFVCTYLATKAHDVGEHDRGQPSILYGRCIAGLIVHTYGLFC